MAETHFHRILRARVTEVLVTRSNEMAEGKCKSLEHYREEVGFIEGLKAALALCEDIERDMDK